MASRRTSLSINVKGDGLKRFDNLAHEMASGEIKVLGARALRHSGNKARTRVKRALAKQTGLPSKVIQRALKVSRPTAGNPKYGYVDSRMEYRISSTGGDISLKYFKPREFRAGVKASPFGERELFRGAFLKGGRFPNRKKLKLGGHVYKPVEGETRWGRRYEQLDSGVVIPEQMVRGASAKAFEEVSEMLADRFAHEIAHSRKLRDMTGGSVF